MREEDAQDDVENASVQSHDSDNVENQSTVSTSGCDEDVVMIEPLECHHREGGVVMEEPLECHQFDCSTEAGLLEGLPSLPLDNTVVKEILNRALSDIINALIEYYPWSELKAQLIMLHKQAGLSIESLAMKNIRRKPTVKPLIKKTICHILDRQNVMLKASNNDDEGDSGNVDQER